ncbi:MAG: AMP-binding enzyme [Opitutaceae bacterium]
MNSADFIWRPEDHPWTRDSHVARFMRRGLGSIAHPAVSEAAVIGVPDEIKGRRSMQIAAIAQSQPA